LSWVEVGRGLVERQHVRHGGDSHPAALAEAEVVGCSAVAVGHAHRGQCAVDPALQVGITESGQREPERHVVVHPGHEELVVGILEDDADAAPDLGQVALHHRLATGNCAR